MFLEVPHLLAASLPGNPGLPVDDTPLWAAMAGTAAALLFRPGL